MYGKHNGTKPKSDRVFVAMLWLLPEEFRERFSAEMQSVFRDQRQDAQAGGRAARVRFWWDTASGLIVTAAREHRDILVQDADYALRMMRKDLGFTIVAVVILGLAIGAGTAAFSAANAILIQPLPFGAGNRLVELRAAAPAVGVERLGFSVKEIEDYRARNRTLNSVIEYHSMFFSLLGGREPERVDTAVVSADFFRVLGVIPLYGRTFMDEDDRPDARPVLILSYEFWQRAFGGDPNVVGRSYSMNDKQHTVVGILPPIPQFPAVVDVYMPPIACPTRSNKSNIAKRTFRLMNAFATLKPGVSLQQAQDDLRGIAQQLQASYPEAYPASKGYEIVVTPVHERMTSDIRPVLIALTAAALLLLVLACSNVAGLMLSRLLTRSKELTVRAALGASRARIVRSFVTEGIMLALAGGVLGLLLAFWSIDILVPFSARFTTLASQLRMGPDVVAFGLLLALLCGFFIAFVPAIGLRQVGFSMSQLDGVHIPARMSSRTRAILVAAQLAVSVVLLVGAGLTLRTLLRLEHIDAGFNSTGVTAARIYETKNSYRTFYQSLLERSRHLDGVEAVALSSTFPLSSRIDESEFVPEIHERPHGNPAKVGTVSARAATPGYFHLMGVPLLLGRDFNADDDEQHPLVTIVNQQLAQHYWPGENPIGKKMRFNAEQERTVVGVIGDVRHRGLDKAPVDEAYCAFTQSRVQFMDLVMRGSRAPHAIAPEVSWIAHDLDPDAVVTDVQALSDVRENSLGPRRNTAVFFSVFALMALAITASGISGLMALEVTERKHEIGVRLALGATPQRVIRSMMRRVVVIIAAGLGCGFLAAWTMSAPMSNLIYGILPRDSLTFTVSSALLVLIGLASSWLPLTRIARLDPTVLLKAE